MAILSPIVVIVVVRHAVIVSGIVIVEPHHSCGVICTVVGVVCVKESAGPRKREGAPVSATIMYQY